MAHKISRNGNKDLVHSSSIRLYLKKSQYGCALLFLCIFLLLKESMEERLYWLGFSLFPGIGPGRFRKLLSHFGTAKDAWQASLEDLKASGIGNALAEQFVAFRPTISLSAAEKDLHKEQIQFLTQLDSQYPKLLAQSKNAPFLLYCKGNLHVLMQPNPIAIVGTRKVTEYGRAVTENFTTELVHAGCVIVSGLALGVDSVAHDATVAAGGKTIAVLGCGVDCCTPRENQLVYNKILNSGGLILSEYGLGVQPTKGSFPSRNRIIAGMSEAVIVTEGAAKSGSLITAHDAFSVGRKVFAVPGPITSSLSAGPYELIKKGAKLVTSAKEIIKELGLTNYESGKKKTKVKADTKEEQVIVDLLQQESLHFDELVRRTGMTASQVGSLLSLLEMKGVIKTFDAGNFTLVE